MRFGSVDRLLHVSSSFLDLCLGVITGFQRNPLWISSRFSTSNLKISEAVVVNALATANDQWSNKNMPPRRQVSSKLKVRFRVILVCDGNLYIRINIQFVKFAAVIS